MSKKIRIEIKAVVEFKPNPEYYPEGSTPEEMLALELRQAGNNPCEFLGGSNVDWTTTGSLV